MPRFDYRTTSPRAAPTTLRCAPAPVGTSATPLWRCGWSAVKPSKREAHALRPSLTPSWADSETGCVDVVRGTILIMAAPSPKPRRGPDATAAAWNSVGRRCIARISLASCIYLNRLVGRPLLVLCCCFIVTPPTRARLSQSTHSTDHILAFENSRPAEWRRLSLGQGKSRRPSSFFAAATASSQQRGTASHKTRQQQDLQPPTKPSSHGGLGGRRGRLRAPRGGLPCQGGGRRCRGPG